MVRAQLGSEIGVAARDKVDEGLLGTIVADGANSFTVSAAEIKNFRVGQIIDVVTKTTGVVGAGVSARTITGVNSATATVTYDGADGTVTNLMGAYLTGQWELASPTVSGNDSANDPYANLNGGFGVSSGFNAAGNFISIDAMRNRLKVIASTTYTDAQLDLLTYNDLVYAIRVNDYPGSI